MSKSVTGLSPTVSVTRSEPSSLPDALLALVAGIVAVDLALAVATPASTQPVRLLLAECAVCVPLAGLVAGIVGRPIYGIGAVVVAPVVIAYAYTGLLLPWTQLSFILGQAGLEFLLGVPVVGDHAATALFGGFTLSQATLQRAFRLHYAVVGLGALAVVAAVATMRSRGGRAPGSTSG